MKFGNALLSASCVCLFLAGSQAIAAPTSSCVFNVPNNGSFTCNIYESLADGTPSEISNIFDLPHSVTAGYIVLLEHAGVTQPDNWSDVLHLIDDGGGMAMHGQLLSDSCNGCFPTFAQVNAALHAFKAQTQTGTGNDFMDKTTFGVEDGAGGNTYNIFSGAPVNENEGNMVPEPASMTLLGSGIAGLALLARRRRK